MPLEAAVLPADSGRGRPRLLYRDTCPPCRALSWLALGLSLGTVRRVPLRSDEAAELYRRFPERRGQLVLAYGDRVAFGRWAVLGAPAMVLRAWWAALAPRRGRGHVA